MLWPAVAGAGQLSVTASSEMPCFRMLWASADSDEYAVASVATRLYISPGFTTT
ncbi:hypothetical protein D3C87_1744960 [compost metagenome]